MNAHSQPKRTVTNGTTIGVTIAPTFVPALKMPVASARSRRGNQQCADRPPEAPDADRDGGPSFDCANIWHRHWCQYPPTQDATTVRTETDGEHGFFNWFPVSSVLTPSSPWVPW